MPEHPGPLSNLRALVAYVDTVQASMSAKRVLITGASGLLGRQLAVEFAESGWEVLGLAFSRATGKVSAHVHK